MCYALLVEWCDGLSGRQVKKEEKKSGREGLPTSGVGKNKIKEENTPQKKWKKRR